MSEDISAPPLNIEMVTYSALFEYGNGERAYVFNNYSSLPFLHKAIRQHTSNSTIRAVFIMKNTHESEFIEQFQPDGANQ